MRGSFLHALYARTNADVAERFGENAKAKLEDHYARYGANELRGGSVADHIRAETVFVSDSGYILVSGWADQRVLTQLHFSVEVGYLCHDISEPNLTWYDRPDVAQKIGDTEHSCGYVALFKISELAVHPRICIRVNGTTIHEEQLTRFLSLEMFMDRALGACAAMAELPIGRSFQSGKKLYPVFAELWELLLKKTRFAEVFSHQKKATVSRSIIITVHRKADMLLRQLEELASYLQEADTEIVLVGNDLENTVRVKEALAAFCQIFPIDITLFVCTGNSGFSAANNFGAERARGEVLIFMNPDIFPPGGMLDQAVSFLEGDPGGALHGAALYYGDGMLMHSGMYVTHEAVVDQRNGATNNALRVEHFGKGLVHRVEDEDHSSAMRMTKGRPLLVTAALWKIRADVFEAAGGFPTEYVVAYYEDADFCLRFLEAGGEIVLDDSSRWLHLEGVSKPKSASVRCFMWLNRVHFSEKFAQSRFLASAEDDLVLL